MSELLEQAIAKLKTCSISKQNEIAVMILAEIVLLRAKDSIDRDRDSSKIDRS